MVVVLADDHGYLDSAPYGAKDVRTPNLTRLADAGGRFTHVRRVAELRSEPGRTAHRTHARPQRRRGQPLASRATTSRNCPTYLKDLGYETAAFGKVAHYKQNALYGFDTQMEQPDLKAVADFLAKRDRTKPLCLFVGFHEPHVPWPAADGYDPKTVTVPPTHVDTPETREFRAKYYTAVTKADARLGEVHDLARKAFGDELLFIYTSDHGAQWPFGKWNLYDAGIRVPFLAAWPGVIKPGSTHGGLASWIDILPTLVDIAGGTPPKDIDGRSFAGVLRGTTTDHRDRIYLTHSGDGKMNVYPIRAVRTKEFKFIRNLLPDCAHTTHIDKAQSKDGAFYWKSWEVAAKTDSTAAKLVKRYRERPAEELYDLTVDPLETKNLATDPKHADRLKTLRQDLDDWMKDSKDDGKAFQPPYPLDPTLPPKK